MTATNILQRPRWSPYVVGAGIGLLSGATFAFMGKALGTSTTFVNATGAALATVAPEHVQANAYLAKQLVGKPAFDWQFALVVALFLGAFLSARLSRTPRPADVPPTFAARFGPSRAKRNAFAFFGGALLLFGARLADGCTSGHGISGGLQLAVSSWTFVAAVFAVGIPFAHFFLKPRAPRA